MAAMRDPTAPGDLIMPIEFAYGNQIVHGLKRYEIRKKPLRFREGTRIWVYATAGSRDGNVGAILGSFIYGGCCELRTDADIRRIAPEAASTFARLDGGYLEGRRPAWALRVRSYQRLRVPLEGTIAGQGIRHFTDEGVLRQLKRRKKWKERRPLSRAVLVARRASR